MKIYEIGTGYTPIPAQVAAATESVVEELTKAFIKIGQSVEIIDISTQNRAENDLPITEVKVSSLFTKSDVSLGIMHKLKRVFYSLALASKLKKIIKKENEKPILHFHNQYNLFFFLKRTSKKLRQKAIIAYTNHNGYWSLPWEEAEETLKNRYFQEIAAMKNADIVLVLNKKMKENIVEHLGVPEDRVIHVNNGVNTDIYSPLEADKIEQIKEKYQLSGKRVILQVGSIYENKGQARSIKLLAPILKKYNDLVYAYAGGIVSEEYHTEVKKTAEELCVKEQVVYIGAVSPGVEMNEIYNIADATVFSSVYEGFPLVCVEAMSAQVPVILCSDTLLDFGEGCIKIKADTATEDIERVLNEDIYDLGVLARKNVVSNYTWEQIAKHHTDIFKQKETSAE